MLTVIIFIVVLSVLIFVHELGHFVMAKRAGMKVEEFGFGFPPRLAGFRRGETVYSLNWIPFGGFVKIYGEDGEDRNESRSFSSKSFGSRLKVILAGVVMNFLLATLLLMGGNILGLRIGIFDDATALVAQDKKIQIISVAGDSPAEGAGLRVLDELVGFSLSGQAITAVADPEGVQKFVLAHPGQTIRVHVRRGSQELIKTVQLRENPPAGQGPLGISMALTGVVSYPWYESVWRGVRDAVNLTVNTVIGYGMLLKDLFMNGELPADVAGPIGIATLTGQAARVGFNYLLQFIAMISVNLAVLNAVPFPALDGGRALMLIIEKIKGSPLNRRVERAINTLGFLALLLLMAFITVRDIGKFF